MAVWKPFVASLEGRFVAASNAKLLGTTEDNEAVVYKPIDGERPLWDFPPDSLAYREVLTYRTSELLGLGVVPETVLGDGIYGPGAVQRFIDIDEQWDPIDDIRSGDDSLWPLALLDIVCNNADRKVGHILRSTGGHLYGIDHGLTFHDEDKLRTVLWAFAGESVPEELLNRLSALQSLLQHEHNPFIAHLTPPEVRALSGRIESLLMTKTHPNPPEDRPPLPWPAY